MTTKTKIKVGDDNGEHDVFIQFQTTAANELS